jgi:antitoxin YefM
MVPLNHMKQLPSAMPASEARINFYRILEEAGEDMRQFTITHRGGKPVVMMSVDEFEGWQETLEIMSNKKLITSLNKAKKELKEGKGIPWDKAKKQLGWK